MSQREEVGKPFFAAWRIGRNIPINVYEGDRPVCQCHTVIDAKNIGAMNAGPDMTDEIRNELREAERLSHRLDAISAARVSEILHFCLERLGDPPTRPILVPIRERGKQGVTTR